MITATQLHTRDFPTWTAYQTARKRRLTHDRIRMLAAANRHLSVRELASHAGVSVAEALAALGLPAGFPAGHAPVLTDH